MVAHLDGLTGDAHVDSPLEKADVMRMRRVPHGWVGSVVARLVAVADSYELRHLKPLSCTCPQRNMTWRPPATHRPAWALREQPGERAQAGVGVGVGRKKHRVASAPVMQDGQLFPSPRWISHDGETVDPAVRQGGCQGRR